MAAELDHDIEHLLERLVLEIYELVQDEKMARAAYGKNSVRLLRRRVSWSSSRCPWNGPRLLKYERFAVLCRKAAI
jgi:hypothetical protein